MRLLGRGREALEDVPRARQIFLRHQEPLRAAGLDLHTANVYGELGRYAEALRCFGQAEAGYAGAGPAGERFAALARLNRGLLLTLLGDFRRAEPLLLEARETFERRGEEASTLLADSNLATLYAAQGHLTRALRLLGEVLAARERAGSEAERRLGRPAHGGLLSAPQPRRRGPGAGRGDRGALRSLRHTHRSGQGPVLLRHRLLPPGRA